MRHHKVPQNATEFWRLTWTLLVHLRPHYGAFGASWETFWGLTWTLLVQSGRHSDILLGRFWRILGDSLAPHLDASGLSWKRF